MIIRFKKSMQQNHTNKNDEKEKIIKKEIYSKPYNFFKNDYKPIVPLKIFQTWYTKDLPPKMRERVETLKNQNPRFKHFLYDDNDCRELIKKYFNSDVLNAYDTLIPGAYKADLWRLCVLYVYGGIYMDIKLICVNGFKLIELTEQNHFIKDRPTPLSIFNSMMVCQKNHPFLMVSINKIVNNVKNKFYGSNPLAPTGPVMLGNLILNHKIRLNIDMIHYEDGGYIIYRNRFVISTEYPEYNSERTSTYNSINTKRYDALWFDKNIYR